MEFWTVVKITGAVWAVVLSILFVVFSFIGYFIGREAIKNASAFLILKIKTSYQFQNSFVMDGRNCAIKHMSVTEVIVVDVDSLDERHMTTLDFKRQEVWKKPPVRRKWSEEERKVHQEQLKEIAGKGWDKNNGS